MATFSATKVQVATYLLGVCPFSIAFLVFLNSQVSFVVTDLIGKETGVGNAVGTLGFADELLAIVACPIWGLLSDRIGVRWVCVSGYLIIGLSLVLFVQSRNVYPQLLLGRLFFSLGGAAASTMVTAVLPTVSASTTQSQPNAPSGAMPPARNHVSSPSVASELAITPDRFRSHEEGVSQLPDHPQPDARISTSRAAGFVGMVTGCGALIALLLFLPLPKRFQDRGMDPAMALRHSFYIVAGIAFFLALWCFVGLRSLTSDARVLQKDESSKEGTIKQIKTVWHNIRLATASGFKRSDIALGYLGGFVARASSVGISLFIPLLVNALFLSSHLCKVESITETPASLPDIKRKCPQAYVLAAEMTGICETVALIAAPIFGYTASKTSRKGLPMIVASAAGMFGYCLLPSQLQADGEDQGKRAAAFIAVSLIGVSQIGAIVCSLGVLSSGILASSQNHVITENTTNGEQESLLESASADNSDEGSLSELKGAVAGIYSFYGGVAILILTKLGGALFDKVSVGAPFYIMAVFNAILFFACCTLGLRRAIPTC